MLHTLNLIGSTFSSSVELLRGLWAHPAAVKPEKTLILYDMEGCPYCRLVREALTELDLDVMIRPCPKGGTRFRPEMKKLGGKEQFPFLVDPNNGRCLYESADIIAYLFETYGQRKRPLKWRARFINLPSAMVTSISRFGAGSWVKPSTAPSQPLELYSFEASPYARMVRELMCTLELPYLLHNVGKSDWNDFLLPPIRQKFFPELPVSGANRQAFKQRAGKISVPYLVDPNTNVAMFESADIKKYLLKTYAVQ